MFSGKISKNLKKWLAGAAMLGTIIGSSIGYKTFESQLYRRAAHERYSVVKNSIGEEFTRDREELEEKIYSELKDDKHISLKRNQFLNDRKYGLLDYSEINVVDTLLEGFNDQETVDQVSRLVKKDLEKDDTVLYGVTRDGKRQTFRTDTENTEIGGVVKYTDKLEFVPYEPMKEVDNCIYYPTSMRSTERSIANFHLHATGTDSNFVYEGPSETDLETAQNLNKPGVVITYLGNSPEDRIIINADFYTSDGEILDLGVYESDIKYEDGEVLEESFYNSL